MEATPSGSGRSLALLALAILLLYAMSLYSYLLFHSLIEFFSIAVAVSIFVIAWNTRTLVGNHFLKLISFFFVYKGLIESRLQKPYSLPFRRLKESEESLRREKEQLEKALADIKTLKGMLPICAHCKKIRNDQGYWEQIESYIRDYSDAVFSHGLCPECARKYFPQFFEGDE